MDAAPASGGGAAAVDTIAAIATASGAGGIGIVRIAGPRAATIAHALTGRTLRPRRVHTVAFRDAAGGCIDRGVALYFAAPSSYTGDDVVELHAHGSPIVLGLLLARVRELGARGARAGEFTERAFLAGKLDLAQAEAVADLIASGSAAAARAAQRSLDGEFSRAVRALLDELVRVRAWLEAALDFPDDDVDHLDDPALGEALAALRGQVAALDEATRRGARLRDGVHAVIVGRPNAGKSSLMNALARSERAIVTAVPGTTRDVLREHLDLDGVAITLVDTAGLRESADPVEREGIQRARAELAKADVAILVTDDSDAAGERGLLGAAAAGAVRIVVHNKIDRSGERARVESRGAGETHAYVSALRGDGLPELRAELARLGGGGEGAQGAFSARQRHVDALARVGANLAAAARALADQRAGELAAEELRLAQRALGEITGDYTNDDLLGAIFSTFCIGK